MRKIKILNLYGEALDLNGDGKVDANDKIALDAYLNFEYEIDQATGTVVSL